MRPITFSSLMDAPRADGTTNLVDWWAVQAAPMRLLSLFGYNNGVKQFVQVFDSPNGPTLSTSVTASNGTLTMANNTPHGLRTGQRVYVPAVQGFSAGVYYVRTAIQNYQFFLYDTLKDATGFGSSAGLQIPSGTGSVTVSLVPLHTFAVAAADNFSCIVPMTGIGLGFGLTIAVSTTAALYTAGSKDLAFMGTYDNLV